MLYEANAKDVALESLQAGDMVWVTGWDPAVEARRHFSSTPSRGRSTGVGGGKALEPDNDSDDDDNGDDEQVSPSILLLMLLLLLDAKRMRLPGGARSDDSPPLLHAPALFEFPIPSPLGRPALRCWQPR